MDRVAELWRVSVYEGDKVIDSWHIENRTESEAAQEAAADVDKMHPGHEWSLEADCSDEDCRRIEARGYIPPWRRTG